MRAVLALIALILVFLTVNLHLLLTTEWWKLRHRRIAAAYREAGQAVIGRHLGMICGGASIELDDNSAGRCIVGDPDLVQRHWVARGKFRDPASVFRGQILTLMAGGEAEREFGFTPESDDNDRKQLASIFHWLPKSDASYEQRLKAKARWLVRRHKPKIDLLARRLSQCGRLLPEEIDALLASVP
jgi:hypothetical protein